MIIIGIYRKKSLNSTTKVNQNSALCKGKQAWAQVEGQAERVPVYFNPDLRIDGDQIPPWLQRWTSLEVLRSTPPLPIKDEALKQEQERMLRKKERCKRQSKATTEYTPRLLTHGFKEPLSEDESQDEGRHGWGLCDEGEFPLAAT